MEGKQALPSGQRTSAIGQKQTFRASSEVGREQPARGRPLDGYASTSICAVEYMRGKSDIGLPMVHFRTHIRSDNSRERTEQLVCD